jgi:Na+-transporting NADH:ubiquinone oxidoreductase subunit B
MRFLRYLENLRPYFQTRKAWRPFKPLFDSAERFLFSSPATTTVAPHTRYHANAQRLDWLYVLASLPAALAGLWFINDPYQNEAFAFRLVAVTLTAIAWEWVFAHVRGRRYGHGVFLTAWLFALISPTSMPPYQAMLAMSFGFVFGRAVFGGAGRNIVNPALLALVFQLVTFPAAGGSENGSLLAQLRSGGTAAIGSAGTDWWTVFAADVSTGVGTVSAAAGMLGAALLIVMRAASWRIMSGCVAGLAAASIIADATAGIAYPVFQLPWHWHLVAGGYVFAIAFLATDAACAPLTNSGRWTYGVLIGALTLLIRAGGAAGFESVAYAVLFASIVAPLIDYAVIERNVRRRRNRLGSHVHD